MRQIGFGVLVLMMLTPACAAGARTGAVPLDHWAYDAIMQLSVRGVIPNVLPNWREDAYTRDEFAAFIQALLDTPKGRQYLERWERRPHEASEGRNVLLTEDIKIGVLICKLTQEFKSELARLNAGREMHGKKLSIKRLKANQA